jgi:hypothetical protein
MVRQRERKVLRAVKAARASRHPNKFTKLKCGLRSVVQMMLQRLNTCRESQMMCSERAVVCVRKRSPFFWINTAEL